MPSLKSPSPALYSSTREAAVSQLTLATTYLASTATLATTYLASFTLAQLALKVPPLYLALPDDSIAGV